MVILKDLTKDSSPFDSVFITEAIKLGLNNGNANHLLHEVPFNIRKLSAQKIGFQETLDWRYKYGSFFEINKSPGFVFPFNIPKVSSLISALLLAKKHLGAYHYIEWFNRISDEKKHFDALSEMLVIANIQPDIKLIYEKRGSGVRDKSIDWLIETPDQSFLLEVKVRLGQLPIHLEKEQKVNKLVPYEPLPDIEKLFKGINTKFRNKNGSDKIQGTALLTPIKIYKSPFENYFHMHFKELLHFVALVRAESNQVEIIAESEEIKSKVLANFGWVDGAGLFIDETDLPENS